ncbi:MAG: hypothetical protein ACI85I_000765 [Arenicella sp.]|jgi:hypothetical protein
MDKDILYQITEIFSTIPNWKIEFDHHDGRNFGIDGVLNLHIKNRTFSYEFISKIRLTMSSLQRMENMLTSSNNLVLVSEHIPKSLRNLLVEKEINYIDTVGNVYFSKAPDLYIHIETGKSIKNPKTKSNRAFTKSGLKVIYQILINEQILNEPYRHIGKLSKVSIDTVGKVFHELLEHQYIVRIDKNTYKLSDFERLMSEWVTVFNKILRPKLKQRRFDFKRNQLKKIAEIVPKTTLGGELAGEILSNHLLAENAICYIEGSFIDFARKNDLIPNPTGNILLMEKFWIEEESDFSKTPTVSPLLVYADLISNPTPRNLETAKIILNNDVYKF